MSFYKKIFYFIYMNIAINLPNLFWLDMNKFRTFTAKRFIADCGKNVNICRGARFSRKLSIGNNSGIGLLSFLQGKVSIGENVMMGQECLIYTSNHKHSDKNVPMSRQGYETEKEVIIEDDVWIGARVTILPGVRVGKGSILGAGAVVTKNVEPYTIVAGNPAKVVKKR